MLNNMCTWIHLKKNDIFVPYIAIGTHYYGLVYLFVTLERGRVGQKYAMTLKIVWRVKHCFTEAGTKNIKKNKRRQLDLHNIWLNFFPCSYIKCICPPLYWNKDMILKISLYTLLIYNMWEVELSYTLCITRTTLPNI